MNKNEITEERIATLEDRVSKLEAKILSVNATPAGDNLKLKKSSAREFLLMKILKSEIQKTLALGYYLEHVEKMESFNVTDLETAFRSAKEKPPKNLNDAVNKNISQGLLMDAASKKDAKKSWVLTSTGEKFVEELSKQK